MNAINKPSGLRSTLSEQLRILKQKKRIIVGLDFGTSTTKVIYRPVETDSTVHVIDFAHNDNRFLPYCMPSSVWIDHADRLWFGTMAEQSNTDQVFRSFKICNACYVGGIKCPGCPMQAAHEDAQPGRFKLSSNNHIDAYEVMIFYLAWMISVIYDAIAKDLQNAFDLDLQFNIGVPVSHIEANPNLVDHFEWILSSAHTLRDRIQQGTLLSEARSLLNPMVLSPLSPINTRRHRAVPETAAAVMWLKKLSMDSDITNYMLIDIGAGTTDITIFRYFESNYDRLPGFGVKTIPIAGDTIDFAIIQWFANRFAANIQSRCEVPQSIFHEIRRRKERTVVMEAMLGDRRVRLDDRSFISEIVFPQTFKIHSDARQTFVEARHLEKRSNQNSWNKFNIVFLGGGSRIIGVKEFFREREIHDLIKEPSFVEPRVPGDVENVNVQDFTLLAVAYGLSHPYPEIPQFRPPSNIQPVLDSAPIKLREYETDPYSK